MSADHPWMIHFDPRQPIFGIRAASCGLATVNGGLRAPGFTGAVEKFALDIQFTMTEPGPLWMTHMSERWRLMADGERAMRIAGPFEVRFFVGNKSRLVCLTCQWQNRVRQYANNRYNITDATKHICPGERPNHHPIIDLGSWAIRRPAKLTMRPTSCGCGGSWAWFSERPSGAEECVGCVCHRPQEVALKQLNLPENLRWMHDS